MWDVALFPTSVALAGATIGAVTDIREFRVYNALTLPLIGTGLLFHGLTQHGIGLTASALGMLFGLLILMAPFAMRLIGAGDVKLMAGLGAWLGFDATLLVFVGSCLVAGAYALILVIGRGRLMESWQTMRFILMRFATFGVYGYDSDLLELVSAKDNPRLRVIPFGAMVPVGMLAAIWWSL